MIKYANIKGYSNLGEVASHLYQWIEDRHDTPKVILVRAYDTETKLWSGYLFNETKVAEYVNVDIKSDMDMINEADRVKSFKEFLKGHSFEVGFKDFKEVD